MLSMSSNLTEIFKSEAWKKELPLAKSIKLLDAKPELAVYYPLLTQFFQALYLPRHPKADKFLDIVNMFLNFASVGLNEAAATRLDKQAYFNDFSRILFLNFAQLVDKTRSGEPSHLEMVGWIQGVKQQMADLNGGTKDYSWFVHDVPTAIFTGLLLSGHTTSIKELDKKISELHDVMLARLCFYIDVQRLVSKVAHFNPDQRNELLAETQRLRAKLSEYSKDSGSADALFKHNPDKARAWSVQSVVGLGRSRKSEVGKVRYKAFCNEYNEVFTLCEATLNSTASAKDNEVFASCVKEAQLGLENLFFIHKLMDHPFSVSLKLTNFCDATLERTSKLYIDPIVDRVKDLRAGVIEADIEAKKPVAKEYFALLEKILSEPLPIFGRISNRMGMPNLEDYSPNILSTPDLAEFKVRNQFLAEAWGKRIAEFKEAVFKPQASRSAFVVFKQGDATGPALAGVGVSLS